MAAEDSFNHKAATADDVSDDEVEEVKPLAKTAANQAAEASKVCRLFYFAPCSVKMDLDRIELSSTRTQSPGESARHDQTHTRRSADTIFA